MYRPEATVEIFECIDMFVDKIISEDKELILMGDMNCNMLAKPLDNTTKHTKRIYGAFGLTLLIKEPTRTTSDTQTLIDHAITNKPDLISGSGVIPCGISDHDMIYIIRTARLPKIKSDPQILNVRNFKRFDNLLKILSIYIIPILSARLMKIQTQCGYNGKLCLSTYSASMLLLIL